MHIKRNSNLKTCHCGGQRCGWVSERGCREVEQGFEKRWQLGKENSMQGRDDATEEEVEKRHAGENHRVHKRGINNRRKRRMH